MPIMYLYNTSTMRAAGVHQGGLVPSGTADSGVPFTDGRMEWSTTASAWSLPVSVQAADERGWRDGELLTSDWTQLADTALTANEVSAWAAYRTELRDLPTVSGFPTSHTRPTAPA
jgi:hypothetical protein